MRKLLILFLVAILSVPVVTFTIVDTAYATEQPTKKKSKKKKNKKTKKKTTKPTTSAEAQRQHDTTEEEIKRTQEEIEANNKKITRQLNQLLLVDADIRESETLIADISTNINRLNNQIDSLSSEISNNEGKLQKLRNNYLRAIKQLRQTKTNTNMLAFIFSSKNFSQAYRRFRYLREFGRWRANKAAQIIALQSHLILQKELLGQVQKEKNNALNDEIKVKENLLAHQTEQKKLVDELKQNGDVLQSHLSIKQAEANNLRAQISVLIAEEQQKAREEEERRRREEEQRRIEEENVRLSEQQLAEEQPQQTPVQEQQNADITSNKKKKKKKTQTTDTRNYADARGRQRRGRQDSQTTGEMPSSGGNTTSVASPGSFEAAKGTLPKPVNGSFKIVNQFGRHAHPDIPGVEYDNPGIDAEVAPGSYAQAVYPGKVSGVYMLKGFRTVIIVNHGKYFTVYGNIDSASVKSGDLVTQGQALGKLFSDKEDNNRTTIHFEVWCSRDKLNPNEWIK